MECMLNLRPKLAAKKRWCSKMQMPQQISYMKVIMWRRGSAVMHT